MCITAGGNTSGEVYVSTDPMDGPSSTWTDSGGNEGFATDRLLGVSCPSTSFCVVYDKYGDLYASNDPTDGNNTYWQPTNGFSQNGGNGDGETTSDLQSLSLYL